MLVERVFVIGDIISCGAKVPWHSCGDDKYIYITTKIHSSCEIEGFVETHLCKLCAILRLHIYIFFILSGFFFVLASVWDSRTGVSPSNRFVRAPSSGGGSNAPRPALSVRHLDVNAYRRWTRQARSAIFLYSGRYTPELSYLRSISCSYWAAAPRSVSQHMALVLGI